LSCRYDPVRAIVVRASGRTSLPAPTPSRYTIAVSCPAVKPLVRERHFTVVFDVLTIAAICDELSREAVDGHGRIQRVIQLDATGYALEIYANHRRRMLVAQASSQNPALYLSSARLTADPDRVSPLLLLLRKYARGGGILAVEQPHLERIVRVSIGKRMYPDNRSRGDDEPDEGEGEIVYTHLIVELMGRHSNVILIDDNDRIFDAAKRVTPDMSRVRPILPGRQYSPPPAQAKLNPQALAPESLVAMLQEAEPKTDIVPHLVRRLVGFSPQTAREAAYRAFGATEGSALDLAGVDGAGDLLLSAIRDVLGPLEHGGWEPAVYIEGESARAFAPIRLMHLSHCVEERFDSISPAIERALSLGRGVQPVRHAQRQAKLLEEIGNARERVAARVRSMAEQQERAEEGERYREMGELIYAYLHQIQPGDTEVDAGGVQVALDPAMSPSDNAQRYFERYRRMQSATEQLPDLLKRARRELGYVEQLETLARQAEGIEQIEQLQRELQAYLEPKPDGAEQGRARKGKRQPPPRRPDSYRTERGDVIYVGRNGPQNERIAFDLAGPTDTWLHAREQPGSHVLVRWAGEPDDGVLEVAASLAAYFSAARDATTVEVDATEARHVRRIRGAGPGMVTYRNERSLNVRPRDPGDLPLENGA
jgi:predicted ribosome quality control (RQC) complex YloA/Tae2 family protein